MSIWVEIHCDTPLDKASAECAIVTGNYPSGLGYSLVVAHDKAVVEAHKAKWVRRDGQWFCPGCSKRKG